MVKYSITLLTCLYLSCAGEDVDETGPEFTFPPSFDNNTKFSDGYFTILNDDVYEYNELIMADFLFNNQSGDTVFLMVQPDVTYIVIKDDDGE